MRVWVENNKPNYIHLNMKRHTSSSSLSKGFSESRVYESFEPGEIRVPVKVKTFDREEKTVNLHIVISMSNATSGSHHQVLVIEITDEQDPFFLYSLECGEAEFHAIKQEQSILVDFLTFPHKLIELLQMCTKKFQTVIYTFLSYVPFTLAINF